MTFSNLSLSVFSSPLVHLPYLSLSPSVYTKTLHQLSNLRHLLSLAAKSKVESVQVNGKALHFSLLYVCVRHSCLFVPVSLKPFPVQLLLSIVFHYHIAIPPSYHHHNYNNCNNFILMRRNCTAHAHSLNFFSLNK